MKNVINKQMTEVGTMGGVGDSLRNLELSESFGGCRCIYNHLSCYDYSLFSMVL